VEHTTWRSAICGQSLKLLSLGFVGIAQAEVQRTEISLRKGNEKEKDLGAVRWHKNTLIFLFTFCFRVSFTIMSPATEACLCIRSGVTSGGGFWSRASSNPLDIILVSEFWASGPPPKGDFEWASFWAHLKWA
jgi:hypothetical protein